MRFVYPFIVMAIHLVGLAPIAAQQAPQKPRALGPKDIRGTITALPAKSYSALGADDAFKMDGRDYEGFVATPKGTQFTFADKRPAKWSDLKFGQYVTIHAQMFEGVGPRAETVVIENAAREISLYSDLGEIEKQIDFAKEYLVSLQWTGSYEEKLWFAVEWDKNAPVVAFDFNPGKNQNFKVFHNRLYVVAKDVPWRVENEKGSPAKLTMITDVASLTKALAQKAPEGIYPGTVLRGYLPERIPRIAVPFGVDLKTVREEPVKDADLKRLAALDNLTYLIIEGKVEVSDAGLKELAAAQNLTRLCLYYIIVTDSGIKELGALKNLTALELVYTPVRDWGLRQLAPLKKLDTLRIEPAALIDDKTLHALRDIGLLHALDGAKSKTDSRPKSADAVQKVRLFDTKITDAGLKDLTVFKNLTALDVGTISRFYHHEEYFKGFGGGLTDAGLKELAAFKNLTALGLRGTSVTNAGLKELTVLKNLTVLDLGDVKVTDVGLKELASCMSLTALQLDGTNVTDAGLKDLARLTNLTTINLRGTCVTEAGVEELRKALPNLVNVRFGSRFSTDQDNWEKSKRGEKDRGSD